MTIPSGKTRRLGAGALTVLKANVSDKVLLVEALGALLVASWMIRSLPFRKVAELSSRPVRNPKPASEARRRALAKRIRWALIAWSARVPWRAVCFQQGLAAQRMLRRRGIAATLYYGVGAEEDRGLLAHVWIKDGDINVIGCENVDKYGLLGTFPGNENFRPVSKYALDERRNFP